MTDNLIAELRAEHARAKEPLQFKWPTRELFKKAADALEAKDKEIERLTESEDDWRRRAAAPPPDSLAIVFETFTHEQLVRQCVSLSQRADRLLDSLEGLHFHHKVFEPDCRHCQKPPPKYLGDQRTRPWSMTMRHPRHRRLISLPSCCQHHWVRRDIYTPMQCTKCGARRP